MNSATECVDVAKPLQSRHPRTANPRAQVGTNPLEKRSPVHKPHRQTCTFSHHERTHALTLHCGPLRCDVFPDKKSRRIEGTRYEVTPVAWCDDPASVQANSLRLKRREAFRSVLLRPVPAPTGTHTRSREINGHENEGNREDVPRGATRDTRRSGGPSHPDPRCMPLLHRGCEEDVFTLKELRGVCRVLSPLIGSYDSGAGDLCLLASHAETRNQFEPLCRQRRHQ